MKKILVVEDAPEVRMALEIALVEAGREVQTAPDAEKGLEVVAEHVQDDETMELLAEYGVEYAQGYHLGEPAEFPLEPPGSRGE